LQFSTKIPLTPLENQFFNQENDVMLLGSCFSENMKPYFKKHGFSVASNPFGILYNPISIAKHIANIANNNTDLGNSIVETKQGFSSLWVHSLFNATSHITLQQKYDERISSLNQQLKEKPNTFIITLGSAWVYKHLATEIICANCHKINQTEFTKQILSIAQITEALQDIIANILKLNPQHQIIFTLSPVRHIKDGFVQNMQSKALLHIAIQKVLAQNIKNTKISYFPAFELMMDELRDYRFYKKDLLHPNTLAIEYIWEKFVMSYFNQKTQQIGFEVFKYFQLKKHKLLSSEPSAAQFHHEKILALKNKLIKIFPHIRLAQK